MTAAEKITVNHDRVAIIGAGPAGLATARALDALAIPYVIFEKHSDVGGIWDVNNEGSPMYRSAHFISSKTMSGHYGFPMPEEYPDYPSNKQILSYIRSFAKAFNLHPKIRFNSKVNQVEFKDERWQLSFQQNDKNSIESFRWLVCANGTNWFSNRPKLPQEEKFDGEIIHAVNYHDAHSLEGQRVLVVGAGNSGVDIACDAAFNADKAYISLRRGYHFVPKHIMGQPADVFGASSDWMPMKMQQLVFGGLLRLINGDLTRLGLQKPDHKVLSSHPILNTQLLHYLQHGDITAKPDIARLDGNHVHFLDGSSIEVDKIILATGYQWQIPYLPKDAYLWKNNRPQTFLKIFNSQQPSLFLNGFVETNGGAYKLFDDMGYLIAKAIAEQKDNPEQACKLQRYISGPEPDLSGNLSYVNSDRHTGYTNSNAYKKAMKQMRSTMEWPDLNESFYNPITTTSGVKV